jgi:hypothetical protein
MGIFSRAIEELGSAQHSEPRLFKEYLKSNDLPARDTATLISIQSYDRMSAELRTAGVFVFRLGSPTGLTGTQFALARHVSGWDDYFFMDQKIFANPTKLPDIKIDDRLRIFEVLAATTETSLVNLAIASGALSAALNIDFSPSQIVHTTAQGTYDFQIWPHPDISTRWSHINGQVEIDAAFIAKRSGKDTLFVVEAKVSKSLESLAKSKLAYPIFAVRQQLSVSNSDIPVVGVYLRAIRGPDQGYDFYIAECEFADPGEAVASLVAKSPTKTRLRSKTSLAVQAIQASLFEEID